MFRFLQYVILTVIFSLQFVFMLQAQIQKTDSGTIELYPDFKSKYVTSRHIEVWLPSHFKKGQDVSVLYMHDGQMLYDYTSTWNQQSWNVDSTAAALMSAGKIKDCIIVGIWNGGETRHKDYFPEKPFLCLKEVEKKWVQEELKKAGRTTEVFEPVSDDYLKCLVFEIKPFIDSVYQLSGTKNKTFISGSSMGGLISMYAIMEYPDVFGGAACLSTHWPGVFNMEGNPVPQAFTNYIGGRLPLLKDNRLYFDYGDGTLDALYPPLQKEVDKVLTSYPESLWTSRFFPGKDHSEKAWAERFGSVLLYLLGK
jgi:hypothetical protein